VKEEPMNTKKTCPRCGRETPANAPEGICPACLVELSAETGTGGALTGATGQDRRAALPVEEVARHFPDLEVFELLGVGGMGAVYKARQPKLDRLVALKILSRGDEDPKFVERFAREAKTLARLNHPHIVAVYEFGERDGLFFLLMELVDGVSLRDLLREGKMQPEQALAIVPPICEALQYAHDKGVVHRDIKPENILLDKEGRVKVADFGIARLAGLERAENLTGEGQVVGTAHYMAPEQVERPASVDHRADIYALGVVFYEMLTGELPLGRFPEPSKTVQIDVRLDEVVLKALEKEPGLRYQQASEVKTRIQEVTTARKAETEERSVPVVVDRPWQLVVVAALFLLFGTFAAWDLVRDWGWLFEEAPSAQIYSFNLGILAIPIGIGLLRLRPWWRKAALVALGLVAALLLGFVVLLLTGSSDARVWGQGLAGAPALWGGLGMVALIFLLIGWQFYILRQPQIRRLYQHRGFLRPWLEWTAMAGVCLLFVPPVWLAEERRAREAREAVEVTEADFGPVIERVLYPVRPDERFLSLTTGDFVGPTESAASADWISQDLWSWLRENPGVDVFGTIDRELPQLATAFTIVFEPVPTAAWEFRRPLGEHAVQLLREPPQTFRSSVTVWGASQTFAFRTRAGAAGLLQIAGPTEDSRGVRIRYRLLRRELPLHAGGPRLRATISDVFEAPAVVAATTVTPADPAAASHMVQGLKGLFFSAYTALVERNDPAAALVALRLMDTQLDTLREKLRGTTMEAAVGGGIAQLRRAIEALEAGNVEEAKVLIEGLNISGPEFEKMINRAAAESAPMP
jgi:tRNA A-37 threonylcarbamoyl transferase component Bud32